MYFFDAHCDTIGPLLEEGANFLANPGAEPTAEDPPVPHVTLPGLKAGGIRAQVFACWAWSGRYKDREYEVGMAKVEAVRRLCEDHADDLVLASSAADLSAPFLPEASPDARIAVLPSLEGADPLLGQVENLELFREAGIRLLTLAWDDNPFCGSAFGEEMGLTRKGAELVEACEALGVVVDVSHLSDRAFADVCKVARRPFVASHGNCRALCPAARNLTDDMIRALGERGGVMGINLAPGFLSRIYYEEERAVRAPLFRAVLSGDQTFDDAQTQAKQALADVPRPPLSTVLDHVKWAINAGGEDCVGLGGDLDGIDYLPREFKGAADYPRIEELLRDGGLNARQIQKVCHENFLRVFRDVLL